MRLEPQEFLRRYLQHTLPSGFHKVRYFGWWSPSARSTLHRLQLQFSPNPGLAELTEKLAAELERVDQDSSARICPHCGCTRSHVLGRLKARAMSAATCRGPPS